MFYGIARGPSELALLNQHLGCVPMTIGAMRTKVRGLQLVATKPSKHRPAIRRAQRPSLGPHTRLLDWVLCGRAISYDTPILLNDGSTIIVERGAFKDWTDRPKLCVCLNHDRGEGPDDPEAAIANCKLGTLHIIDRPGGLDFRCRVADTDLGRMAVSQVWDGKLTGASVNWLTPTYGRNARGVCTLVRGQLREISLAETPCDCTSYVDVVHAPGLSIGAPDFEERVQAAAGKRGRGMSTKEARRQLGLRDRDGSQPRAATPVSDDETLLVGSGPGPSWSC